MNRNLLLNKAAICFLAGIATAGSLSAWDETPEQEQSMPLPSDKPKQELLSVKLSSSQEEQIDSLCFNSYPTVL